MNYQAVICTVITAIAVVIALLNHRGVWRNMLASGILATALFTLSFSVEQSARDAATTRDTPNHIETDYGAGIYAMKSAMQTERICLALMIVSLGILSLSRR